MTVIKAAANSNRGAWRMNEFKASGVVTLTTDFGHKGPFAAVMKGVMLSRFPRIKIIDLAHDIPAHWPPEAGFWLSRSYSYFPVGTVHVAIVDHGVGTERDIEIDDASLGAAGEGLGAPGLHGRDDDLRIDADVRVESATEDAAFEEECASFFSNI